MLTLETAHDVLCKLPSGQVPDEENIAEGDMATLTVRMTRVRASTEWPCRISFLTVSSCSDLLKLPGHQRGVQTCVVSHIIISDLS